MQNDNLKFKIIFLVILFFSFFAVAKVSEAATVTVCPSDCTGTNVQTIYNNASCGDTIELHWDNSVDNYGSEWYFNKDCTGSPITIKNGTGHTPILTNTCVSGCGNLITISGKYQILQGFTVSDNPNGAAVWITGNNNIVQNMTFSNNDTGAYPGAQSYDTLQIYGSSNIIQNNTFGSSGHGSVVLFDNYGTISNVRYNQILNNTIHDHYGHGISLLGGNVQYNLIDGNKISDSGSLCVGGGCSSKNCFQLSGARNNSFRRNVCFDAYNRGMEISSYSAATDITTGNWIYNNTFYNISTRANAGNTSWITIGTAMATHYNTDNHFYSNIAEKVAQVNYSDFSARVAFLYYYATEQDLGDNLSELTTTNDWRNNWLKNNDIRPYNPGSSSYDNLATAIYYTNAGGTYHPSWTVTGINGLGSQSGNIMQNPQFSSTDTSQPNWWYLQGDSPLIDAGIVVDDPNAAVGGWTQLSFNGSAPDIGAYEYAGATPPDTTPPAAPTGVTIN